MDVLAVVDVTDVSSGEPLFSRLAFEDWVLLSIWCELHLFMLAVRNGSDDPVRNTFPTNHLSHYYSTYFLTQFMIGSYGFKESNELAVIIKDKVQIKGDNTELAHFVKLTEVQRRVRFRRLDAGDESVRLRFIAPKR